MRTFAVAVVILGACFMQEVSGSVFLRKAAPKDTDAALKENMKDDKEQHLVVDKKDDKAEKKQEEAEAEKKDEEDDAKAEAAEEAKDEEKDDKEAEEQEKEEEDKEEEKQTDKKDAEAEKKEEKKEVKAEKKEKKQEDKKEVQAEKKEEKKEEKFIPAKVQVDAEKAAIVKDAIAKAKAVQADAVKAALQKAAAEKALAEKAAAEKVAAEKVIEVAKATKAHEEALKKMSETNGAPSQGFNEHSDKTVEYNDMKNQASDWGGEWPQTDETDSEAKARICRTQEVQSKWCKEMGFASLLEREQFAITPMEDSYDPDSDANNPENPLHKHDEEVHAGEFFQTIQHPYDKLGTSSIAMDRVSSPAEQMATNREFVAPHNPDPVEFSFLQTSQSSQPKQSLLQQEIDDEITDGLREAENHPREEAPNSDYE